MPQAGEAADATEKRRTRRILVHPNALAARAGGVHRLIGPLLLVNAAVLVVAWFMPIMTISRFVFWDSRFSILDAAANLWDEEHYFTFTVIVVFSMIFPVCKLLAAFLVWLRVDPASERTRRALATLGFLGKWSMLDVFVVALTIVAINISIVSDVAVHAGLYVFTGAVIASILLVIWVQTLVARFGGAAPNSRDASRKPR